MKVFSFYEQALIEVEKLKVLIKNELKDVSSFDN